MPTIFHDRLILQTREGLHFWPLDEIAMLREEYGGRLEATNANGDVAHCPGPLPPVADTPWIEVGRGTLVHPAHARRQRGTIELPGGWRLDTDVKLPRPRRVPAAERVLLPGTSVPIDEVLYLDGKGYKGTWHTERGTFPAGTSARKASTLHPDLVAIGHAVYVNLRRLRALLPTSAGRARIILDGGHELDMWSVGQPKLRHALGLKSFARLGPQTKPLRGMLREGLRDWPVPLWEASADQLKRWFATDARRLMANVVWQVLRLEQRGVRSHRGHDLRGFWYTPLLPILVRAGLARQLGPGGIVTLGVLPHALVAAASPIILHDAYRDPLFNLFAVTLTKLVGDDRLFTYTDLGFIEPHADQRGIGERLPNVLLLVEKSTLDEGLRAIIERFSPSWIVMGGMSKLISTEFLAAALRAAGIKGPLVIIAYVDYDYAGWNVASGFVSHLARYGYAVRHVGYIVRPSRFTKAEIASYALPLPATNNLIEGLIRAWLERGGGIDGKGLGLHADHLWPVERVVQAMEEELIAAGVLTASPRRRSASGAPV